MKRLFMGLVATVAVLVCAAPAWASFGFAEDGFQVSVTNENGTPDTQAGSHPFAYTTTIAVKETEEKNTKGEWDHFSEGGDVRDIEVELPPGLVGDPGAVPACSMRVFTTPEGSVEAFGDNHVCPDDTQIGWVELDLSGVLYREPVYNLAPPKGSPAEFGFIVITSPVVLVPYVRTGSDYGVSVRFTGLPTAFSTISGKLTLWGVPASPAHNGLRGACLGTEHSKGSCPVSVSPRPFLSLPTSCTGPLSFKARIDSWEAPGVFQEAQASIPGMTGCEHLSFAPNLVAQPEPAQAASPSGLSVEIQVPQTYENPEGLAETNLKNTTVTLPAGVAVNPSAADGLAACSEEQIGLHDDDPVTCPDASKVGSVEVTTPLLTHPLVGGVYLAQQGNLPGNGSNPFGSLLALYLAVEDPYSGVLVKLAGEVKPDPVTGQLVTTFLNNPQVPFDSLRLSFFGGPRAALVNPPLCGSYTTTSEMSPWSGGASASPSATFAITAGSDGGTCLASQPFNPQVATGTTSNQAGAFSPFSLTFDRSDAEQDPSRIQVHTPPGMLGDLSGVALCGEPQAQAGTCGSESEIGHVTVAVGSGSNPFYTTGTVHLTGSYAGAPYGLSFVVPAVAGPLNLGVVVVRAAVSLNTETAALTVTSQPLPQILQGVPLHIRAVNVTLDRPSFVFNPTNCDPLSIQTTMSSAQGASVSDSTSFQVTNCAALAFKPSLSAYTSGHTSRSQGASLDVRLSIPKVAQGTQANIARVKVELPKSLPSRLSTLQKACLVATFEANPAACPAASRIGYAQAKTPVLPVELSGPVYFVSHGGEAFPSLIVVLQGYGVRVDLVGSTFISKKGITSSTFKTVPDVPVETFELYLPEGPYSALTANKNLCKTTLAMPTEFTAQDGTRIHQSTPIAVTGCATKTRSKHKATHASASKHKHGAQKTTHAHTQASHTSDTGSHG